MRPSPSENPRAQETSTSLFKAISGDAASIPVGTTVGKWRLAAFLGRGGTYEVFRARHVTLPLVAAVKILVRDNPSAKLRFDRETQFLFENRDASFPRYFGSGEYEGRPFVAVELLEPIELPHRDKDVEKYILAVADGVIALHRKGLVHCDLKPQNVMRRKNGDTVIIDLGLVKEISEGTQSAASASNVHALGALLDACFYGLPPRCWAGIVRRATSPIPEKRYISVSEFVRAVKTRHRAGRIAAVLLGVVIGVLVYYCVRKGYDEYQAFSHELSHIEYETRQAERER